MTLFDWIPALSTTTLLMFCAWLMRTFIQTRLTKSVEHEFNSKLELVKNQLRDSEERLKSDLRSKEAEISSLRSGALAALSSRQVAVDKRRLEAIDQLWSTVITLNPARNISNIMKNFKFDEMARYTAQDPKAPALFSKFFGELGKENIDLSLAQKARPYVTVTAWAAFQAMAAVCIHAVVRLHILKSGVGDGSLIDDHSVAKLIKAALPEQSDYIDKFGADGYHYVIESLEQKLLTELQGMIEGRQLDKTAVVQAAEILRQVSEISKENASLAV